MKTKALDVLTLIGVACAILTTGVLIKREMATPAAAVATSEGPTPVENWEQYVVSGRIIGKPDAPLKIVEFADFQCPACRALHILLSRLRKERPDDFAISYHYVPLPYHAQAYPAARAAECAVEQGRFEEYHDGLFAHFDSLSQAVFVKIARDVHIPDLQQFEWCLASKDSVARINSDRKVALERLHIRGTPTTLVNGQMYTFAPTVGDLQRMIDDAKANATRK